MQSRADDANGIGGTLNRLPDSTPDASGALQPREESAGSRVRPATSDDVPFVIALAARFGSSRAPWRGHDEVVAGTARQLAAALDNATRSEAKNNGTVRDAAVLIAVGSTGERVGFAYLVTHEDFFTGEPHAHLSEIATVTDRSGAGSALMNACEEWARERGFRYLSLNVNDANESARRFYARRAYVPEYRHLVKLL